jgi:coenzyme F420-0:L-glutamate ligase/coenzyme F420-1:gamma-L-glutamate ligase
VITLIPIEGIGEISPGDEIADLLLAHAELANFDVLVITQKAVSKAEGRLVPVAASPGAGQDERAGEAQGAAEGPDHSAAAQLDDVPDRRTIVLSESARVLRERGELIISETHHGFICANAGVDLSNVAEGWASLLPVDPDRSARYIRDALRARGGVEVGVIVSDTFGRPWRHGLTDVAIGCAGVAAVVDLRGTADAGGRPLAATEVCVVDELAGAAELAKGKASGVPAVIVRGVDRGWFRESSVRGEVVRPHSLDLFR